MWRLPKLLSNASAASTEDNGNGGKKQNGDAMLSDQAYGSAAALQILQDSLTPSYGKSASAS